MRSMIVVVALAWWGLLIHDAVDAAWVDARVHRTLRSRGRVNVIATMKSNTRRVLRSMAYNMEIENRGEQIAKMVDKLKQHAVASQKELKKMTMTLRESEDRSTSEMKSFWISNQMYYKDASAELVQQLVNSPNVATVREERVFRVSGSGPPRECHLTASGSANDIAEDTVDSWGSGEDSNAESQRSSSDESASSSGSNGMESTSGSTDPTDSTSQDTNSGSGVDDGLIAYLKTFKPDGEPQVGLQALLVPEVWASGYSGQGVVVGIIDTGALATHEAIGGNFRREFGWYDPETLKSEPYDADGHGTHTLGTIVGSKGIGVAPNATWIACKGCRQGMDCHEADLLDCAQFMLCPTDPTGQTEDCSQAPHVINNSWGGGQNDPTFKSIIDAWEQAGIIPVFSTGNRGPSCGSILSPADYPNVIAVGALTESDRLRSDSARGPTMTSQLKPELVAPGTEVLSAWGGGRDLYFAMNGTSMAAPHVTGTIALMLSANPKLTYNQVRQTLLKTANQKSLSPTSMTCGEVNGSVFPNNFYGYGRVDAWNAVTSIRDTVAS